MIAWIAPGLTQLLEDVRNCEAARGQLPGVDLSEKLRLTDKLVNGRVECFCYLLHHRIRLRMHSSAIQRILAVANTQEAGGLLEGLGADAGNFVQLRPGAESSVLVAIGDDIERGSFGNTGDEAKQGPRKKY